MHLAAMTIIYGQRCKFDTLPYAVAYSDVFSALIYIPELRWQWERKDVSGGDHPITAEIAHRVFRQKPLQLKDLPELMPEEDWDVPRSSHPTVTHLGDWPAHLFMAGPAWPENEQWGAREEEGPSNDRRLSLNNGPIRQNNGPNQIEYPELDHMLASVPNYMSSAINLPRETESHQLFIQEERDPMPKGLSHNTTTARMVEPQLQHMVRLRFFYFFLK